MTIMAKTTTKKVTTPEPELPAGNRYQRAARVCIAHNVQSADDIDIDELAKLAELGSASSARYTLEAWLGCRQAMIEAKWLEQPEQPVEKPKTVKEPIPAK
jgi:hypothetical protein